MKGLALLGALLWTCGSSEPGTPRALRGDRVRGADRVGGEVVSTVDGYAIRRADVVAAARSAGVPSRTALARLQDETLLAHEARRAGVREGPEVRRAVRQAMVQALLRRTVEEESFDIDDASVRARFEQIRERFVRPERRASAHVLARVSPGADEAAARSWIQEVHEELRSAEDPVITALSIRRRNHEDLPFEVLVQEIQPSPRDAPGFDPAYLEALFEAEAVGVLSAPVRTGMGYHVIILTWIEPARATGEDEAVARVRAEREAQLRLRALDRWTHELARDFNVHVEPDASALLANPRILGAAR